VAGHELWRNHVTLSPPCFLDALTQNKRTPHQGVLRYHKPRKHAFMPCSTIFILNMNKHNTILTSYCPSTSTSAFCPNFDLSLGTSDGLIVNNLPQPLIPASTSKPLNTNVTQCSLGKRKRSRQPHRQAATKNRTRSLQPLPHSNRLPHQRTTPKHWPTTYQVVEDTPLHRSKAALAGSVSSDTL
jgi:hypothetical protein